MLPSGKRAKNAHSISLPSLRQHYLVAMATFLDKLENNVQIHPLHIKLFQFIWWKYCENQSSISGAIWWNTQVFWLCRTWSSQM